MNGHCHGDSKRSRCGLDGGIMGSPPPPLLAPFIFSRRCSTAWLHFTPLCPGPPLVYWLVLSLILTAGCAHWLFYQLVCLYLLSYQPPPLSLSPLFPLSYQPSSRLLSALSLLLTFSCIFRRFYKPWSWLTLRHMVGRFAITSCRNETSSISLVESHCKRGLYRRVKQLDWSK
jgi:hypothetical protein